MGNNISPQMIFGYISHTQAVKAQLSLGKPEPSLTAYSKKIGETFRPTFSPELYIIDVHKFNNIFAINLIIYI